MAPLGYGLSLDDGPCKTAISSSLHAPRHGAPRIRPSNATRIRGEECPFQTPPLPSAASLSNGHIPLLGWPSAHKPVETKHFLRYVWLRRASRNGGLPANPSTGLPTKPRGKTAARAEARTDDSLWPSGDSSSADSQSAIGHGYTRTGECGHLNLDTSLVRPPVNLYLAEPPSFTPSETPIEVVPEPLADLIFGGIAVDDAVALMHVHLSLDVVPLTSVFRCGVLGLVHVA